MAEALKVTRTIGQKNVYLDRHDFLYLKELEMKTVGKTLLSLLTFITLLLATAWQVECSRLRNTTPLMLNSVSDAALPLQTNQRGSLPYDYDQSNDEDTNDSWGKFFPKTF